MYIVKNHHLPKIIGLAGMLNSVIVLDYSKITKICENLKTREERRAEERKRKRHEKWQEMWVCASERIGP